MMIHIAGAVLLILAGGLFAKSKISAMKAHLAMLYGLMSALEVMACEIRVRLTPLGEIIESLAHADDNYAGAFFARMSAMLLELGTPYLTDCWRQCAENHCQCLTQRERAALAELGEVLGRYDVPEECSAIDRCVQELKAGYDALSARYAADARLYAGIGLAGGCILAIVFL